MEKCVIHGNGGGMMKLAEWLDLCIYEFNNHDVLEIVTSDYEVKK